MNTAPLAEQLRPKDLSTFAGQQKLVGKDGIVRKLLQASKNKGFFPSLIFWGPPGVGKTTLARIIANTLERDFYEFSAVSASVKDIQAILRKDIDISQNTLFAAPVVFVDEIHRFNKAQQDRLLPHVERGDLLLIGATTENPSFEVIGPLLSRSRVLVLTQLEKRDLNKIIQRAEKEIDKKLAPKAKKYLAEAANGDARVLINVFEIASHISKGKMIEMQAVEDALQKRQFTFDKQGEDHYNTISAYIKSMRASDPNAALYYLARMVEAGQDPLYIARRMVIFASEDIGMAQPTALVVANEVFRACEVIGYPECAINLAHGTVYLAQAKKDRSAYEGLRAAQADVMKYGNLPIPMNLRNAVTSLMKDVGYRKGYETYPKDKTKLMPEKLQKKRYIK